MIDNLSLDKFDAIKNEVLSQTDRGAAILAGSLLEEHLKWAIKQSLVELSNKETKVIFDGVGPLATFKARADIAYALGLIDHNLRAELGIISQIRNRFAHRIEQIDFDDSGVAELCGQLLYPKMHPHLLQPVRPNRSKYLYSCWLLRATLLSTAQGRQRPVSPLLEKDLEILAEAAGAVPQSDRSF